MAFDYSELVAVALELIDDFGRDVTLNRPSAVLVDPLDPSGPSVDEVPALTVKAAVVNYDKRLLGDGAVIQAGDKRVLIAAAVVPGLSIDDTWRMIDGGTDYTFVNVNEVAPGDTVVLFDIQARS